MANTKYINTNNFKSMWKLIVLFFLKINEIGNYTTYSAPKCLVGESHHRIMTGATL